jgi:transcription-repair coupling factor (superfamily II helicase)
VNLQGIAGSLSEDPRLDRVIGARRTSVEGLAGSAAAAFYSALFLKTGKTLLVISQDAEPLSEDIKAFIGADKAAYFPAWDTFPTEDISPSAEIVGERLTILDRLLAGEKLVITANIKSAVTRVIPKNVLLKNTISLQTAGKSVDREGLIIQLVKLGFKRRDIVGERGEFAVRGGILDIFAPNLYDPVRIELVGDKIESIRSFDAASQRSRSAITGIKIFPIHELVLDGTEGPSLEGEAEYKDGIELKIPQIYAGFSAIFEYLGGGASIILDDPRTLRLSQEKLIKEIEELRGGSTGKFYLEVGEFDAAVSAFPLITRGDGEAGVSFDFAPSDDHMGRIDQLIDKLIRERSGMSTFIVSKQADRLHELFIERGLVAQKIEEVPQDLKNGIYILFGKLRKGFRGNGLEVLTDRELFGEMSSKVAFTPKPSEGVSEKLLAELNFGDYVVHSNYGIGIYRGLKKLEIDNSLQEYIQIDYAQDDKLYVPLHQMGLVEKYSGGGDYKPKVGRLGGTEWARQKSRAKKSIKDITEELMDLYVSRHKMEGVKYPPDSMWEMEFEKSFPYEETPDQAKAIREIKKDMESGKLIDRLVCGDVGYGKTEVALRAAFKAAVSGQQVAVLTPTTVLADQHFHVFSQRFKPYPITVEALSRFKSKDEQKQIIKSLEAGAIDVVIGTHRLIQKDVKFKNLGLLIIDEEQKFGVSAKEKLKQLSLRANVITLSATPIPRTLYMALSGVREMSIIATPPLDRSPVRTYLREFDENTIKEAIRRELERGGQVFFVHNIVKSIDKIAALIKRIVPEARIAVAHGQMKETSLEDIMIKFVNKEFDVLLSTSIIESGLDIPSVNTVIIDNASEFGLSQLYQIRGRVGRSSTRAFAYLLYHKEKVLTDKALERLKAIQEFTALGSGYKLAMADLEIRGAGNILGGQQHGHLLNIGFDLYCDLLEESVRELKHIEPPAAKKVFIDLKMDAFIPTDYVTDDKQRIALYRRMNTLNDLSELEELKKEMIDRFGHDYRAGHAPTPRPGQAEKVPTELGSLFDMIQLKIEAGKKNVTSITGGSELVEIKFDLKKPLIIRTKGMPKEKWFELVRDKIRRL